MKKLSLFVMLLMSALFMGCSEQEVYLFSYFKGNGEDGLHLAYSYDGLKWETLKNDKSFLTPQLGKDKLMRDPSITRDDEGTYHMVWTTGWWDQGIGYASSKDLVNWSEQMNIPVIVEIPPLESPGEHEVRIGAESEIELDIPDQPHTETTPDIETKEIQNIEEE